MSTEAGIVLGAAAVLFIASVSGRLDRLFLTEPLVAAMLGVGAGLIFLDEGLSLEAPVILTFLELTLALVLFADASRIDVTRLREGYSWPLRMLVLGMPIVIALGASLAGWYLSLPLGVALLLATLLAPTDAALAAPVLEADSVPERVRQTLNVESGLNDGLAVPVLLIAIGLIESESGTSAGSAVMLVVTQLGIGIVAGVVLGWLGAKLIGKGTELGWMNHLHQKVAATALAIGGYAAVQLLGGSGFVAVFIAGGLMSHFVMPRIEYLYEFAETEGHALVLVSFLLIGAGPIADLFRHGAPPIEAIVMALVSLLILRPVAIAVSLVGQKLAGRTVVFLGWFGPRGLATVVFMLVALEETADVPVIVTQTVTVVVALSILLHGLSAVPMSRWLGNMMDDMDEDMPEMGEAVHHPMPRG